VQWRRKSHRLPADRYIGEVAYSLTLVTQGRQPHFVLDDNVAWCLEELTRSASSVGFEVMSYVFMPDHLHLLVLGIGSDANLPRFVKLFKQRTAYWFKQRTQKTLWQKSYFDHALRRDEDVSPATEYLAGNPLHAGLAADWRSYKHWGGPWLEALANENQAISEDGAAYADLKVAATSPGALSGGQGWS
jgi:putative transposase